VYEDRKAERWPAAHWTAAQQLPNRHPLQRMLWELSAFPFSGHTCAVAGSASDGGTSTPETSPSAKTRVCDTTRSVESVSAAPYIVVETQVIS